MIIPREFPVLEFKKILDLLGPALATKLEQFYEKDENDYSRSFVLNNSVEKNSEAVEELVNICDSLLIKCFEGEKFLWEYFQPGIYPFTPSCR